jgi:hypothetical protein
MSDRVATAISMQIGNSTSRKSCFCRIQLVAPFPSGRWSFMFGLLEEAKLVSQLGINHAPVAYVSSSDVTRSAGMYGISPF